MRVLAFGRTGQVGRALAGRDGVTSLDRAAVDLTLPGAAARAIAAARCDAVINATAYTAVDRAEADASLALRINGAAVAEMATACAARDVPFLTMSTDYVFDGSGSRAWRPDDTPAPLNAYGRTKLAGERAALEAGGRCAVLRTSWVFDATARNFVTTMLRLARDRDEVSVVADQIGGPTPAWALADALIVMARGMVAGKAGGIYHLSGAPDVSWADFAKAIFASAKLPTRVRPIASADFPTPARRPVNARLDCSAIRDAFGIDRPDWRADLARLLATEAAHG